MKAQIPLIELIIVVIALFVAFGVLFPGFVYKNKWKEAITLLSSRDLILTMDRIGKLYEYSFNKSALSGFLSGLIRENFIPWSEIEGTFPNQIVIACNCTEEEISKMNLWFNPLVVNNRRIYILFQNSKIEEIPLEADVLLIKGYKNLTDHKSFLENYLSRGIGVIELMNFDSQSYIDNTQAQFFGINCTGTVGAASYMNFSKPANFSSISYIPYKNFYHVPIPFNSSFNFTYPDCPNQGKFVLNRTVYSFWICNNTYVWFDVDANGTRDVIVRVREKVKIGNYNFTLSYIHNASVIAISFFNKPEYKFGNYLISGKCNILPNDGNYDRILVKAIGQTTSYPAVILNSSRVVWMYDFGNNPSDDEKNLLISLILGVSKKKSTVLTAPIQKGFSTSYVNVQNYDIFEIYKFTLGLAYPY